MFPESSACYGFLVIFSESSYTVLRQNCISTCLRDPATWSRFEVDESEKHAFSGRISSRRCRSYVNVISHLSCFCIFLCKTSISGMCHSCYDHFGAKNKHRLIKICRFSSCTSCEDLHWLSSVFRLRYAMRALSFRGRI